MDTKVLEIAFDETIVNHKFYNPDLIEIKRIEKVNDWFYTMRVNTAFKYLDCRHFHSFGGDEPLLEGLGLDFSWTRLDDDWKEIKTDDWESTKDHQFCRFIISNLDFEFVTVRFTALKHEYRVDIYELPTEREEVHWNQTTFVESDGD